MFPNKAFKIWSMKASQHEDHMQETIGDMVPVFEQNYVEGIVTQITSFLQPDAISNIMFLIFIIMIAFIIKQCIRLLFLF